MRSSHLGYYLQDKYGHIQSMHGLGQTETDAEEMTAGLGKTIIWGSVVGLVLYFIFLRK